MVTKLGHQVPRHEEWVRPKEKQQTDGQDINQRASIIAIGLLTLMFASFVAFGACSEAHAPFAASQALLWTGVGSFVVAAISVSNLWLMLY